MKKQTKRMISILLTLSILAAFAMAPMVSAAEETRTVYFDNSSKKWSQVYAYTWDANNTATNGTWPGTAMTLVKDSVYAIDIPVGSVNIIFTNNAGTQTADLVLPTDGTNLFSANEKWETYSSDADSQEPIETEPTTSPQIQYIVAGDAALCGSDWDPTDTRNLMTDENGDRVYEIWYPDVPAGTYELKITDGTWNNSWGKYASQDNYVLQVSFRAKVKLTFNSVQKHIVSNVIKLEDAEPEPVEPVSEDYYLVGYINGANYGCEEDSANMGEYKFVDGKLTATFEQDSYVFLKKTNNAAWYLAENYCTDTTCTFRAGIGTEKMYVPGGKELEFSLVVNEDGSLTLSYTQTQSECAHNYIASVTTAASCETDGLKTYTCSYCSDSYSEIITATGHSYVGGVCSYCNASDPTYEKPEIQYCLFGINLPDGSAVNGYNYPFVDGKITVTFGKTSYLWIITNKGVEYKTDGWQGAVNSVTLMTSDKITGTPDKLMVPAGTVTLTLVENDDGTLTLSYEVEDAEDEETDFYLVGYINGANYGCEEDYENMGSYKFVDGKLTVKFETNSYIFVKTAGNGKWLLSNAYCTDTTCTFKEGGTEKMLVPGGVELTFTLNENTDGSVTLSYVETDSDDPVVAPSVVPTLTLKAPTLEFKDMITVNAFYTAENNDDVVEMGMITYSSKVTSWNVDNAEHVIPGANYDEVTGRYFSSSQGIHAKHLGDTVYLAVYAKLADGTYAYSKLASYSAVTYAINQLKNSTDTKLKQLVAAMLNYGAEAQLYFGHNTSALANSSMTSAQKALPAAYNSSMVNSVPTASAAKQGSFANNQGFASRKPAISFEGAFCINYFFTPNYVPDNGITLYYWNATDYNAVSVLNTSNATGSLKLTGSGTGEYRGDITGISAKDLSEAVYVAAVYTNGGTTWTSGVLGYSIGAYCSSQVSKAGDIANLAMTTAVYGYHAKQYFG